MGDRSLTSLSVLGPLEAADLGGTPVQLGSPQQRRVLAVLAVHGNQVVSSDRLVEVLWGDAPPTSASHTLQALVSRLRRRRWDPTGSRRCHRDTGSRVDAAEVDSLRFEELVRAGLGSIEPPESAAAKLTEALALWRGRPYAEFADEEFAAAEVARLEELRLCAIEEHAGALVELGRPGEIIGALESRDRGRAVPRAPPRRVDVGVGACGATGGSAARVRELSALPRRRGGCGAVAGAPSAQ